MTKYCQGELGIDVEHDVDEYERSGYPFGVGIGPSPLFDLSREPWILINHCLRQMITAYQIIHYSGIDKNPTKLSVMDFGCGFGEMFTLLSRYRKFKGSKFEYIGVDMDRDRREIALELRPKINYILQDIPSWSDFSKEYDCITSSQVLEHFTSDDSLRVVEISSRLLRSGGLWVMDFASPMSVGNKAMVEDLTHDKLWSTDELSGVLSKLGIEILDAFYINVPSKEWDIEDKRIGRIPPDVARTIFSVFSSSEGKSGVIVGRKL